MQEARENIQQHQLCSGNVRFLLFFFLVLNPEFCQRVDELRVAELLLRKSQVGSLGSTLSALVLGALFFVFVRDGIL